MGKGGNSKENIFALQAIKLPCMKKNKVVYLKTHKVGKLNCIFVGSSVQIWKKWQSRQSNVDVDCGWLIHISTEIFILPLHGNF